MAYSITDERTDAPRMTPAVQWLIALSVAVYFLQLTVVSPAGVRAALAFTPEALVSRPWTVVTYMFVHAGFWHLALNMYALWLFGPRLERAWSSQRFVLLYLWSGLGGWLFHLMLAREGYLLGASAAVFGVMLAYAMRWPDDELLLFFVVPIKVRWLVVLLVGANLAIGIWNAATGVVSSTAYFAHLGGFAFAWVYLRWSAVPPGLERLRQRMAAAPDLTDEPPRPIPRSPGRARERERGEEVDEIVARSNALLAKRQQQAAATTASVTSRFGKKKAEALDDVLDKIAERGIESLTPDERQLLDEMSRRLRND